MNSTIDQTQVNVIYKLVGGQQTAYKGGYYNRDQALEDVIVQVLNEWIADGRDTYEFGAQPAIIADVRART